MGYGLDIGRAGDGDGMADMTKRKADGLPVEMGVVIIFVAIAVVITTVVAVLNAVSR